MARAATRSRRSLDVTIPSGTCLTSQGRTSRCGPFFVSTILVDIASAGGLNSDMDISEIIRKRIKDAGKPFHANDTISQFFEDGELDLLEEEVSEKLQGVLNALIIDTANDHNTHRTAERMAKMYLREVFAGRYHPQPLVTDFPNAKKLDELYTVGPCRIRSACSHHFCPIEGQLWCGVIPGAKVIGLSKFSRIARWVMTRPQIQEESIVQLANLLEELIAPRGLAVVMKASHSCMTWRGVMEESTTMTTSVVRGILKESPASRTEFFQMITAQGFAA